MLSSFKKIKKIFLFLLIFYFISCFLSYVSIKNKFPKLQKINYKTSYYDIKGTLHIHTKYSDGGGTIEDIGKAANENNLDFVIITDHNTLKALKEKKEGYYGKSLVLIGIEITLRNLQHLLAFDVPHNLMDELWRRKIDKPQSAIDIINFYKGVSVIAHHVSPTRPWREYDIRGYSGIEIWNFDTEWRKNTPLSLIKSLLVYPFNPKLSLSSLLTHPKKEMSFWDRVNKNKIIGTGGVDAHSSLYLGETKTIKFIPFYKDLFLLINIHLLSKEKFKKNLHYDKKIVYNCIRGGNFYISSDYPYPADGFMFYAEEDKKQIIPMQSLEIKKSVNIKIRVPYCGRIKIKLIRDSKIIKEINSSKLDFKTNKKGVYRCEVSYGENHPWIFSEPIYLK